MGANVRAMREGNSHGSVWLWMTNQSDRYSIACEAQKINDASKILRRVSNGAQAHTQSCLTPKLHPPARVKQIWVFVYDCSWPPLPSKTGHYRVVKGDCGHSGWEEIAFSMDELYRICNQNYGLKALRQGYHPSGRSPHIYCHTNILKSLCNGGYW